MTEKTVREQLLDVVDVLTKTQRVAVWRDTELVRRSDPALLVWLKEAITNSLGKGGGSQQPSARTPLDVGAFTLFEDIDGRVRSWIVELGGNPNRGVHLAGLMRYWLVLWRMEDQNEFSVLYYLKILSGWVQAIRDIVDSPDRMELTSPCPNCGRLWVTTGVGEERVSVRALWAVWRSDPELSFGMCRGCDKIWSGVGGMRLLRIQMDDFDAAKAVSA